jgi:aspartate/methionine/tyrosine aminotransferase
VKRLERKEENQYRLDADSLRKTASEKTGLLVITNPHAPSSAVSQRSELEEIMEVAREFSFFVVCDEIYAEFDRKTVPAIFSVDRENGIVTTSFTKAYGLGGLKLGTALASRELVDEFYVDVLNTVGNSPNVVQLAATDLLENGFGSLERHQRKRIRMKHESEKFLKETGLEFFPNKISITYWVKLPISDTHKWINEKAIPHFSLAPVPGTFFLFEDDYRLRKTNMARLGLGNINPESSNISEAFDALKKALKTE